MRFLSAIAVAALAMGLSAGPATAQPLAGTWIVAGIGGDPVVEPAPTLIIDGATFTGNAGCNGYFGTVTINAPSIAFGPAAATKMMCLDAGVMAQESLLLSTLADVRAFTVTADELALYDAAGVPVIMLLAAEFTPIRPPENGADITIRIPGAAAVATETVAYRCGTRDVTVDFINAGATSLAVLRFADETVVAANVIAASGARYAGGQYIFWTHGGGADLYDIMGAGEDVAIPCIAAP